MKLALVLNLALICAATTHAADSPQSVRFVVHVPADTPAQEHVWIAGSSPTLGNWKPAGSQLARQPDGTYRADVDLPLGESLEFKITRGTWQTVERDAAGHDRSNRVVRIDPQTHQIEVTVERWANGDSVAKQASTVVGNLKIEQINSHILKQARTIRIWLPAEYSDNSSTRLAVLYMHDGQNCFDRATSAFGNEWDIDESLTRLIAEKRIPPLIVVGIDNGLANRIGEYTYDADSHAGGGQGAAYSDFVLHEVKPFIDKTYRTRPDQAHTIIGGSSLGGLISLEIARRSPNMFGGVIAMSPSLHWANESMTKAIEADAGGLPDARVWIDTGSREGSNDEYERNGNSARRLDAALTKHHVVHHFEVDEQHPQHNEAAWASRFPRAISYLLNPEPDKSP